jgi:hypothetical protein
MKAIVSIIGVAILSIALSGCWVYSHPDSTTGCQQTTYGVALSSSTSESCPPAPEAAATPAPQIPPSPPPLPSPGQL